MDSTGGGDVVGEEADGEEELAGAACADGAGDPGAFVVWDCGVGEGGVVIKDGVEGEEGSEVGEDVGFGAGVVEVEDDDGLRLEESGLSLGRYWERAGEGGSH